MERVEGEILTLSNDLWGSYIDAWVWYPIFTVNCQVALCPKHSQGYTTSSAWYQQLCMLYLLP